MKKVQQTLIACTGGGSGGHVFPAFGVIDELAVQTDNAYRFVWIGSSRGVERRIVEEKGIPFYGLSAGKLRRYFSFRNVLDAFRFVVGIFQSLVLLARLRPILLFSKGGFVSVAPVIAAGLMGIPVVGHESDCDPGLATRINLRFTALQCIPFVESQKFYPAGKKGKFRMQTRVVATGNPVRQDILRGSAAEGKKRAGFSSSLRHPVLLVQGGSLGARQINELIAHHGPAMLEKMLIIHQTGDELWKGKELFPVHLRDRYFSRPFFSSEYLHILAAADLVLSRAGAGSVWEFGLTAKPTIFIPLEEGSRGDQGRNAEFAARRGAALVCSVAEELDLLADTVTSVIGDKRKLGHMAAAWSAVVHNDGAGNIAGLILELLGRSREEAA